MTKVILLYFFILVLTQCEVVELTNDTFKNFTTKNNYAFVYFYSPTCKFCMILEPDFKKLSENFNQTDIKFGKIDATVHEELSQKYGIESYPTLFFFDYTFVLPYQHDRSLEEMTKWIKGYLDDRVQRINSKDQVISVKTYIIIQGGNPHQNKVLNQSVHGIDNLKAYSIGEGNNGRIKLYTPKGQYDYNGDIERIALRKWIKQHLKTAIISLSKEDNVNKYLFHTEKPALLIVFAQKDRENQQIYDILLNTCQRYREKINCLEIIPKYPSFQGAHGYFQVGDTTSSIVGLVRQKMNIAYRMDIPFQRITGSNLENFIEGALNNTIKRLIDNVAPSAVNFNSVKVLTSQNLQQTLLKNKYVFVNFYKSDDEVSLIFSRPYESFATIVKQEDELKDIIVAAIDCKQFQELCNKLEVTYYPTLRFYIDGYPVEYERTQKLPQVPHLTAFVASRKLKAIKILPSQENLATINKPIVVVKGKELTNQIRTYPAGLGQIQCYFLKTQQEQPKIELHIDDSIIQYYKGQRKLSKIKRWIKTKTDSMLSDMMKENPDEKIIQAVRNKKPILFLLDVEKDKSSKYKANLGSICKSIEICGAYADITHPGFNSLLQWVGLPKLSQSKLIYSDVATDKKYLYPHPLDEITTASIENFITDISSGFLKSIPSKQEISEPTQKPEEPIVEQL